MASDFVIEVAVGGAPDQFSTRVVHAASGGEPTATMQLDVYGLVRGLPALENTVLASAVSARRALPVHEQQLRDVGERLFRALFTGDVYGAYRASLGVAQQRGEPLRVVLRLTAATLSALPWEALFDPETGIYLCRTEPLVRHVPAPYTVAPQDVVGPLRILVVIASPRDLPALDVDGEHARLSQALAGPVADGLVEVHWLPQATWSSLHDKLMAGPWHALHFVGHGDYSVAKDQGLVALVGADGRKDLVEAERLADLLHEAEPMPRLVVLNSCASGQEGTADLFSGTASALAHRGVAAVAAMQFSITDQAALEFSRGFYTALAHGRGVDAATRSGRIEILGIPNSLEWVTPVLYLRGDTSRLFNLQPRPWTVPRAESAARAETAARVETRTAAGPVPPVPVPPAQLRQRSKRRWVWVGVLLGIGLLVWAGSGPLSQLWERPLATPESPIATPESPIAKPEPPLPEPEPPLPKPPAELSVPFAAPAAPGVLNPTLSWQPGGPTGSGSPGNGYTLEAPTNTLGLTAGADTKNWGSATTAPMILYQVSGDFSARVRVQCDPSLVDPYSGFGLGVRSPSDHLTWVQIARSHALFATKNVGGKTAHSATTPFGSSTVELRISRVSKTITLSYAGADDAWVDLASIRDVNLPVSVQVYLFTFRSGNPPLTAHFSDLKILPSLAAGRPAATPSR